MCLLQCYQKFHRSAQSTAANGKMMAGDRCNDNGKYVVQNPCGNNGVPVGRDSKVLCKNVSTASLLPLRVPQLSRCVGLCTWAAVKRCQQTSRVVGW